MARLLLLVFLCLVSAPSLATAQEAKGTCKLALTSMAVISCQESQQFPTRSCCDALLTAVDLSPEYEPDKGLCCLCRFATTRYLPYDIFSVYHICGGKDASLVGVWPVPTPVRGDCSGPCRERSPAPPPPSGSSDGHKEEEPELEPENTQGSRTIAAIVLGGVGTVVVAALLACCCLHHKRRAGVKARESPRPSDAEFSQGTIQEMSDMGSSSRNLMS